MVKRSLLPIIFLNNFFGFGLVQPAWVFIELIESGLGLYQLVWPGFRSASLVWHYVSQSGLGLAVVAK